MSAYKLLKLSPVLCLLLTGCLQPPYNNYKSTSSEKAYVRTGLGSGLAIGSVMGSTPIGAVTGGLLGLARGHYLNSVDGLTQELRKDGIAIYPQKDQITILIPTDTFYEVNRAKLRAAKYKTLNRLASLMAEFQPDGDIYVAGFTDNIGTTLHQQEYSMHLAEEMAAFLWAHGIHERNLHVEGYGSRFTIADNNTIRGNAMNRRVEIQWRPRASIPVVNNKKNLL